MNVKTLGSELNSIHDTILVKKSRFDAVVNNLQEYVLNKTDELNTLIQEIEETSRNLNHVLYLIEVEFENLLYETELYLDNTNYYEQVLPVLKEKFKNIFNDYLSLFELYEKQIEELVGQNVDSIINEIPVQDKYYKFNIFNVNKTYEPFKQSIDFLQAESHGTEWYEGKFEDEYLAKTINGSLNLFHVNNRRNEKLWDYNDNKSSSIYEMVFYHPDYGMCYYKTTGTRNTGSYLNPKTRIPNINIDFYSDEFKGEISELKQIFNAQIENKGSQLIDDTDKSQKQQMPLFISFTHINTANAENIRKVGSDGQMQLSSFIMKINVHEAMKKTLPHIFEIGQNKDIDKPITLSYTSENNSDTVNFLNIFRDATLTTKSNSYYSTIDLHNNLMIDNNEDINLDEKSDSSLVLANMMNELYSEYHIINIRDNTISKLSSVFNITDKAINNYYYNDEANKNALKNIIIATIKNSNQKISSYVLFENWVSRIANVSDSHIHNSYSGIDYFKIKLSKRNNQCYIPSRHILQFCQPLRLYKELFNDRIIISFIENSKTNYASTITPNLRNDNRVLSYDFLMKYLVSVYNLKKLNFSSIPNDTNNDYFKNIRYSYLEYFDFEKDPLKHNLLWFVTEDNVADINNIYKWTNFSNYLVIPRNTSNYYSNLDMSVNALNSPLLEEKDLEIIKEAVRQNIINNYINSKLNIIGELIFIPYDIDNPTFIFEGRFAKSGSILRKDEYPEAYNIFQDLFNADKDPEDLLNSHYEFALPNLSSKYIIGADDTTIFNKLESKLPKIELNIKYDSESSFENPKFTGLISDTKPLVKDGIIVTGLGTGPYGNGFTLSEKMIIQHKSTAMKNKGNDARVDVYIRVK